eukprot:TRINITY_DN3118_c0_g1_i1.p1 TRINITY_DN3118_c0_g1~~TRINITY_DN3118_c0_g1_i1.p1  ORF type:complete len:402 (-),score=66.55 TRINITY_DN3118_c0_g1_i1:416-1621(-)
MHQQGSHMQVGFKDNIRRRACNKFRRGTRAGIREFSPPPAYNDHDAAYFSSYSHVGIHEEMIKDRVRTDTYRTAILQHRDVIQGKVVVDVGCGTGILSIFCALAGARKVYAIDASDIAVQAAEVVKANNLADKITVLHGRVEEVEIDEEVDTIVSEWMGYMLLYESMLSSVIFARDRWLKPGGVILPSHATLYMAPVTHPERYSGSIDFWRNVYGIDMSAMIPLAKQCAFEEPCIEPISAENVLTWPIVIKCIDCSTVSVHDLESITTKFSVVSMMNAPLHGFAIWFDVTFGNQIMTSNDTLSESSIDSSLSGDLHGNALHQRKKRGRASSPLVLSTAPEEAPTHWAQTVLYIYEPLEVKQDQIIEGSIRLSQSRENTRFLNIHLEYASGGRCFVKESILR